MNSNFVHLHCHSYFSLLDGMTRPTELVDRTLELGQPASCITDHGNLYSIVDHFQYAEKHEQKAIAGFEAYVVKDHKIKNKEEAQSETEVKREHLVLLATDNEAYKRLMKICSVGMTDGFYYRPRIDDNVLLKYGTEGLIGLSACIAGRIAQNILKDRIEEAEKWAIHYYKMFHENFYLEMQPTKEPAQVKVNLGLIEIHKKTGIPMVVTTDSHYLKKEDSKTHDLLLCMQSNKLVSDPNRWKFPGDTFYVMSREEILDAFKSNGHEILDQKVIEEAANNTVEIANKCNVTFKWGDHKLPKISIPNDNEEFINWEAKIKSKDTKSGDYLKYLCIKGLKEKKLTSKVYRDRLDYELKIINDMGFPDYFLIMEDIMRFCRNNNIPTGPARGCHLPDSKIHLTNKTIKNIQDIKIGDEVIGHTEVPNKIINKLEYDCKEEITILECNNKKVRCTNDHGTFAIKKEDWDKGIRKPKWYKANDLNEGDYIAELE